MSKDLEFRFSRRRHRAYLQLPAIRAVCGLRFAMEKRELSFRRLTFQQYKRRSPLCSAMTKDEKRWAERRGLLSKRITTGSALRAIRVNSRTRSPVPAESSDETDPVAAHRI